MHALNEWNRELTILISNTMNFKDASTMRALRTREYITLFDKRFSDAMSKIYKFEGDKIFAIVSAINKAKQAYIDGVSNTKAEIAKTRFWELNKRKQLSNLVTSLNHKIAALTLAVAIVEGCRPTQEG